MAGGGKAAPSRRSAVRPFVAMDVLAAANRREAEGLRVIHMEVGQPSAPTPKAVVAAARKGLTDDRLGYTEALGIPALRKRISRHYADAYGVDVDPARIAIIELLASKTSCISGDIAAELPLARTTVTQHLQELKTVGLIRGDIDGLTVCYCLNTALMDQTQALFADLFAQAATTPACGPEDGACAC